MGVKRSKKTYVVFIRGINVGGKNKIPMASLKECLEQLGFSSVSTYIASGNVVLESDKRPDEIRTRIEEVLPERFRLDDELVRVLVLTLDQLHAVIANKPEGFGEQPEKHHSDVIFLIGIDAAGVIPLFRTRDGVDRVWPGKGVVYSQRLSAQRTKSRLKEIMATPEYKFMTIRNWRTTTKLLEIAENLRSQ
jgi:uncharacterized protein (DUF1697 family)